MTKRRSSILTVFFLPMVAFVLLAFILTAAFLLTVPQKANDLFGPPSSSLSSWARFRLSAMLLLQEKDLVLPTNPAGNEIPFPISSGESTGSIIQRLAQDGLITNPGAFRTFLQYSGLDTSLQAGNYSLNANMTPIEIANAFQDATPSVLAFHILAGWRVEEIAGSLLSSGLETSPKAFTSTVLIHSPDLPLADEIPDTASLEGFLFPGQYEVARGISAPELVRIILARFDETVTSELRLAYESQDLTLYEAVILASIVEREAVIDEEMPLITSVLINRLTAGMRLETDPTVQYALGYNEAQSTWWTNPLSLQDLEIESLYNTYLYPGLPPGPIANPGMEALRAVAFPAQTPYFYFRARCDGSGRHFFEETFEGHLQNACP